MWINHSSFRQCDVTVACSAARHHADIESWSTRFSVRFLIPFSLSQWRAHFHLALGKIISRAMPDHTDPRYCDALG